MKGPPLRHGEGVITWPDQVAPRGRKASSTRKIKPQIPNLTAADHRSRQNNSTDRRQSQISERKSKDSNKSEQTEHLQEQQEKASPREKRLFLTPPQTTHHEWGYLRGAPFHIQPMRTHWHQAVQDGQFSKD